MITRNHREIILVIVMKTSKTWRDNSNYTYSPEVDEELQIGESHIQTVDLSIQKEQYKVFVVTKANTVVNPEITK